MGIPLFLMPNDYYYPMRLSEKIAETRFTWAHALYLPKWQVHVLPSPTIRNNIELSAIKLERICTELGKNAFITSWYRPDKYNEWPNPYGVKGAESSAHCEGLAIDFYLENQSPDKTREILEPKLEQYGIRMERFPGSAWVHIDLRPVVHARYFIP